MDKKIDAISYASNNSWTVQQGNLQEICLVFNEWVETVAENRHSYEKLAFQIKFLLLVAKTKLDFST